MCRSPSVRKTTSTYILRIDCGLQSVDELKMVYVDEGRLIVASHL
jgi:hypothetical protein